ncbi:hypothetical protein [Bradyrhizobium sp. Gha]
MRTSKMAPSSYCSHHSGRPSVRGMQGISLQRSLSDGLLKVLCIFP